MSLKKNESNKSVLVIFGKKLPSKISPADYSIVVSSDEMRRDIESKGFEWRSLSALTDPGSIYEASVFTEELSRLRLPDGSLLAKSFTYKGYEMWWVHYNGIYNYFALPYTQYRNLLIYLREFQCVSLYQPPFSGLFCCYLKAYNARVNIVRDSILRSSFFLPIGIFVQIILTLCSIPVLMIQRKKLLVYTGDSLERDKDYSFRLKPFYLAARRRGIPFVEIIRSLEPWRTVVSHFYRRGRPVIYSEAIVFIGRYLSILTFGHRRARRAYGAHRISSESNAEFKFKYLIATQFLLGIYDDVWAIRLMSALCKLMGTKAAFIAAASERNIATVIGCKINNIPTIGILHGVASKHYNVYDFLPSFEGEKSFAVDTYGLWSEWWKEYYTKYSRAYTPSQLIVSGPIRPRGPSVISSETKGGHREKIRALFVGEQLAVPEEVLPYLITLIEEKKIELFISFRAYRDTFEDWLKKYRPDVLSRISTEHIIKTGIIDALQKCDIAVGTHSTGVLEALYFEKPIVFFDTKKWGDYFSLSDSKLNYRFFAKDPQDLIRAIMQGPQVPRAELIALQRRFFGNPNINGSEWVVDEVERILSKKI